MTLNPKFFLLQIIVSSFSPNYERDFQLGSAFLTKETEEHAILGSYTSLPSIGLGKKLDFTYNGGYLQGSYLTVAMENSVPLELAEIRAYGSKFL